MKDTANSLFPDVKPMVEQTPKASTFNEEYKTKGGYFVKEVVSALQKSVRRGDEFASMFWAFELYELGWWAYLVRRLVTIAGEDCCNRTDLMAQCATMYMYWKGIKAEKGKSYWSGPHWDELAALIVQLCRAKKNRYGDLLYYLVDRRRAQGWKIKMPKCAVDQHTPRGKEKLKETGEDKMHQFYHEGARTVNHEYFDKEKEMAVKNALMKVLNLNELVDEEEEITEDILNETNKSFD